MYLLIKKDAHKEKATTAPKPLRNLAQKKVAKFRNGNDVLRE